MQGAIRCMTVRQLYPQDMQALSTFVRACNDGGLLEATLSYYLACIGCNVLKEYEDVVGRTRDQRRVCGAGGRRDGLSLWHGSVRARYGRLLHYVSKWHNVYIGS
jgi:hypothetical protein